MVPVQDDERCRTGVHWQDAISYLMIRDKLTFSQACDMLGLHRNAAACRTTTPARATAGRSAIGGLAAARRRIHRLRPEAAVEPGRRASTGLLQERRGLTEETIRKWELGFNPTKLRDGPLPGGWKAGP